MAGVAVSARPCTGSVWSYSHVRSSTILNQVNSTSSAPRTVGQSTNSIHKASFSISCQTLYPHLKVARVHVACVIVALETVF